ncbi:MAG: hypothetical protein AB7K09_09420 [Planctomycetota bacterium]
MKSDTVRNLQKASPFRPFRLHMADGRSVLITHPEMMWLPPDERMLFAADTEGTTHFIDLFLVTDATLEANGDNGGTGRKKKTRGRKPGR